MKKRMILPECLPAGEKFFAFSALLLAVFLRVCIKLGGFNNTIRLLSVFERKIQTRSKLFDTSSYGRSVEFSYCFALIPIVLLYLRHTGG